MLLTTLLASTVLTTEISMSCDTTATILRQVTTEWSESIKWAGLLSDDGGVLTIHQNDTTGAWTLLLSTDNGVTCVAGYGTDGTGR